MGREMGLHARLMLRVVKELGVVGEEHLKVLGVAGVFPTGSRFEDIAVFIRENAGKKEAVG